jgi:hypothetical protein
MGMANTCATFCLHRIYDVAKPTKELVRNETMETGFGGAWNCSKRTIGFDGWFQLPISGQFIL